MCGILLVRGNNAEDKINKYLIRIAHRGTEPYRILKVHEHLAIGFVRLPINDASENASQPFVHKNLTGVFNCEIYNHSYLTRKFELQSYLKSECDAEIILPLFQTLLDRPDIYPYRALLSYLDGFYSGIIYDKKSDTIFCIRDYIGKKPLFVIHKKDLIIISSELKAVNDIDDFEVIPKGISIIKEKDVKALYSLEPSIKPKKNENIQTLLYQAVKKRIPKKKDQFQFGVFLSGGIDSSIVASLTNRITKEDERLARPMFYYLSNFNKSSLFDHKYIDEIVDYLNIDFNCAKRVSFDDKKVLGSLQKTIYHTESFNPSIVSNGVAYELLTSEVKKDGIKVVITGDGADEMFLGYFIKNQDDYKQNWSDLLNDLENTELRRIDLISMANNVEVRCPFLDKKIYNHVSDFLFSDFYGSGDPVPKNHLKQAFKHQLPHSIISRKKTPLDVGSGIQQILLKNSDPEQKGIEEEKEFFKNIWLGVFPDRDYLSKHDFFHRYKGFESFKQSRWDKYSDE